ncbi:MAG: tRNA pseudouridine55 synthase [Solirubrobacteraceae bacterium]|jgi:tRNA pseudouridine55 synthase|nr:tRNA pseudouridine55 synthase [Solirubrobacteraceae bacterium]
MEGGDGVVLVDKPAGKTSHDVVAAVRRGLPGKRRVGHAGTLDPFATGLLLVLVGRATRAQRFLMELPKTYVATARFGAVSSTGDPEGEIVETGAAMPDPLVLPTGDVRQRPPAHSAVKVDGERAYARARRGEEFETAERTVTVHRFELLSREADRAQLEIECSSGTYVRSLVADLGDAYCEALRRTAIGPFSIDNADGKTIVPLADALSFLPEVALDPESARRASHGVAVEGTAAGPTRLTDPAGLVAIAEPREDGTLKPVVGFRSS